MNKAIEIISDILISLPGSQLTTRILDRSMDDNPEAVKLTYVYKDDDRTVYGASAKACLSKLATSYLVESSTKNMFSSEVFTYEPLRVIVAKDPSEFRRNYASIDDLRLVGDIKIGHNCKAGSFSLDNFGFTNGGYLSARLNFPRTHRILDAVAQTQYQSTYSKIDAFKFHPRTTTKFGETEFITFDLEII